MTQAERSHAWYLAHKELSKARSLAWKKEHPEQRKAKDAAWKLANPDKVAATHAASYRRHLAERTATGATWRSKHKDEAYAARLAWDKIHPENVRAMAQRRRCRRKSVIINDLTADQWKGRVEEYGGLCAYCLRPMPKVTLDHMTPLVRGGSHTLSNVVPCCKSCNSRKGTKTLLEYVIATRGVFQ